MSRGRSTAKRYAPDSGPIVFGAVVPLRVDVRWNRETRALVVDMGEDARWCETGELAERLLLALAHAHRQGRLSDAVRSIFDGARVAVAAPDGWYRCGRLMLRRPAWQEARA